MLHAGLNYTTECSILAQPSPRQPEHKTEADSKQGTQETGTAGSGRLGSGHPCLMLWVHIPKRLFHMVLWPGV